VSRHQSSVPGNTRWNENNSKPIARQDRGIGGDWLPLEVVNVSDEVFEKHCFELEAFKEEFGHCNVPMKYPDNQTFLNWCSIIRNTYNRKQMGLKPTGRTNISQDRIDQLEQIGFQWRLRVSNEAFEKLC